MSSKADSISAWSLLQLLRDIETNLDSCPICHILISWGTPHGENCELKRHIDRLIVESGDFQSGVIDGKRQTGSPPLADV